MSVTEHSVIKASVVAQSFSRAASGYDGEPLKFLRYSAEYLVESLNLDSPQGILDIATGTGQAAMKAAQAVQPDGFVTAADISPGMLEQAEKNALQAGIKNITFKLADCENLPFEENSFDAVSCSSGIYIMRNIEQCVSEWVRVVKPGGKVGFSSFGEGILEPMMSLYEKLLRAYNVEIISPTPLYRVNTAQICQTILENAGLGDIEIKRVQKDYYIPSVEEWITLIENSGFRFPLERLDKAYLPRFIEEHKAEIAELATEEGIRLSVPIIAAIGRKV